MGDETWEVLRRFSEFEALFSSLSMETHPAAGQGIPPPPSASPSTPSSAPAAKPTSPDQQQVLRQILGLSSPKSLRSVLKATMTAAFLEERRVTLENAVRILLAAGSGELGEHRLTRESLHVFLTFLGVRGHDTRQASAAALRNASRLESLGLTPPSRRFRTFVWLLFSGAAHRLTATDDGRAGAAAASTPYADLAGVDTEAAFVAVGAGSASTYASLITSFNQIELDVDRTKVRARTDEATRLRRVLHAFVMSKVCGWVTLVFLTY